MCSPCFEWYSQNDGSILNISIMNVKMQYSDKITSTSSWLKSKLETGICFNYSFDFIIDWALGSSVWITL